MATLLLRLAGPMQSWGTQSRFSERDTGYEPSKSGVIGLVCAALGRPRDEPIDDLATLRMGVRVDREGTLRKDYQTAGGTHRQGDTYGVASASGGNRGTIPSNRYYLADASFLVGLESDDRSLLEHIDQALRAPRWQLFLGRKLFVPSLPVRLPDDPPLGPGLQEGTLEDVFRSYPWLDDGRRRNETPGELRTIIDAPYGSTTEARRDLPISFKDRSFGLRYVKTDWIPCPEEVVCIFPN